MKHMKNEQKTEQQQIDKPLHDLIDIIQFAEKVTAKIHGLRDEAEIFKVVIDEFSNSDRFISTILLLSDDGLSIKLSDTSLSSNNLKAMEKAAGVFREHYKIDLNKSSIFSRVVRDGETIIATGSDIIGELFPRPLGTVIVKLMGLGNQPSILTPLYRHEKIIGILSLSAPELGDLFITSVKNLAHHITIALELADEHTERKQAEEALKESEAKYRNLLSTTGIPITYFDLNGYVLLANEVSDQNFHTTPDRLIGKSLYELLPGVSDEIVVQIRRIAETGEGFEYEDWRELPSGTFCFLTYIQPMKEADGSIQGVQVISHDITERKLAEDALRGSEEKYRSLVEQSLQGHLIFQDDRIVFTNQAFANITGYSIKELMDFSPQYVRELVHPADRDWVFERFNDRMTGKTVPLRYEYRLIRKDSSVCWVETYTDRINYLGNLAMQATFLDITERKQAEEETKKLNTQLMEANVVLEEEISERKQAEAALRHREERFRSMIESADDAITLIDIEGTILYASPSLERIAGYDASTLVGTSFQEYMHPDDFTAMESNFTKIINTPGHAESISMRLRRSDGSWCWVEGVGKNFLEDPHVQAIVCNYRDITERKQAEEALRNSEAHWRSLIETAPNIIMSVDRDGTIWSINRIVPGLTREQVIGSSVYDFIDPEFHNTVRQTTKRVLQTGNPGSYEIKGTGPDGSVSWHETQIGPVTQDQEVVALTLITTDITDRKNSEEEVMQRNRELAALNEIAQKISQTLDLDEILDNAFNKTIEILNIKDGSVHVVDREEKHLIMRIPGESIDEELEKFRVIKMGEGHIGITAKSGEPLFVETLTHAADLLLNGGPEMISKRQLGSAMFIPLKAKGNVLGVMAAFTEEKRVFTSDERELLITIGHQIGTAIENAQLLEEVSRAEALEELDKLRTALLASVSHELRTPLTSIKGLASTLTQPDVEWDTETQQDFLKIIDRESDILTHIVEDLMQMSQMEAGIMSMEKTRSNIASIVHQLGDKLSDLAVMHEFETDNQIIVSVTDNGIGIPPEHMDKVFDRFYRLESGVARRRGGTGLGISICKGIVEGHNGEIWVKSTPDKGSTFSFSLPITDNSEMVSAEQIKQ